MAASRMALPLLSMMALLGQVQAFSAKLAKNDIADHSMLDFRTTEQEIQRLQTIVSSTANEVSFLESRNALLRSQSYKLNTDIEGLRDHLKELKNSFKLGKEFADKEVHAALESDKESLRVFEELDEQSAKARKEAEMQTRIQSVGRREGHLMLQTEVKSKGPPLPFPEQLDVIGAFPDSEGQTADDVVQLESQKRRRVSLLQQQQAHLDARRAELLKTEKRLSATVARLTEKFGKLQVVLNTLRAFGRRVGTDAVKIDVSLLQMNATYSRPHSSTYRRQGNSLDDMISVGDLSENAAKSYASIENEANELRANVANFQQGMQESFADVRDSCKQELQKQHATNMDIAQSNAYSAEVMKTLGREIRHLQRTAEQVEESITSAQDRLQELGENVSVGRDFIEHALAESRDRMQNGESLKSLAELDRKLDVTAKKRNRSKAWKRMSGTSGENDQETSLLQFRNEAAHDVSERMLTDLVEKLKLLNARGEQEKQNLLKLCQTGIEQGLDQHTALSKEQASIEGRLKTRSELKDRLALALQRLKSNLKQLRQRHRSLALFAKVVGDRAIKAERRSRGHISLLQFAPGSDDGAISSVSSRVSQLQERLTSLELENRRKQAALRARYDANLKSKQQETVLMAQGNMKLVDFIEKLRASNAALRKEAEGRADGLEEWDRDWSTMDTNLSAALTVSRNALATLGNISQAPELKILHELDLVDQRTVSLEVEKHRFDDIFAAEPKLQLLQLSRSAPPRALLYALDSGIADLEAQEERTETQIKEKYSKALKAEDLRLQGLRSERDTLEAVKRKEEKLQERLREALEQYVSDEKELTKKAESLRAYASNLGERPLPVGSNATPAEATTTTAVDRPGRKIRHEMRREARRSEVPTLAPQKDADEDIFNTDIDLDNLPPRPQEAVETTPMQTEQLALGQISASESPRTDSSSGKKWLSWLTR